jgi:hypothetical protein
MTVLKTDLKINHVYRVSGRPLQLVGAAKTPERFEALRYVGTTVPYRDGIPDIHNPTEVFYRFSKRQWVLFKPGTFEAQDALD